MGKVIDLVPRIEQKKKDKNSGFVCFTINDGKGGYIVPKDSADGLVEAFKTLGIEFIFEEEKDES